MFERFTDRARRVVVLAQEESRLLGHNYIGTEHLLLGLIQEGEGVAARVLANLGVSRDAVRARVMEAVGGRGSAPSGHIPFTPRAKKVLELSLREALQLGHNYIGTEHLLLGLVREGEGVAAQVLLVLGADLASVRHKIIQTMSGHPRTEAAATAGEGSLPGHTPAGRRAAVQARRLAGAEPVGSQHYLLGALDDEGSVASRALEALGITRAQVEAALAQAERAGSSDETMEEAGARHLRLVVDADGARLEILDPDILAILEMLREEDLIPESLPGGHPLAGRFPELWTAVREAVEEVKERAAAAVREGRRWPPDARS